jgi:hypothetical protein
LVSQIKGFTDEGLRRSTGPSFFPTAWLIHQAQDVRKSSEDHQIIYIIVTVQQLVAYLQSMAQDPPGRYSWTDRLVARKSGIGNGGSWKSLGLLLGGFRSWMPSKEATWDAIISLNTSIGDAGIQSHGPQVCFSSLSPLVL